jgi:hypothetical protein
MVVHGVLYRSQQCRACGERKVVVSVSGDELGGLLTRAECVGCDRVNAHCGWPSTRLPARLAIGAREIAEQEGRSRSAPWEELHPLNRAFLMAVVRVANMVSPDGQRIGCRELYEAALGSEHQEERPTPVADRDSGTCPYVRSSEQTMPRCEVKRCLGKKNRACEWVHEVVAARYRTCSLWALQDQVDALRAAVEASRADVDEARSRAVQAIYRALCERLPGDEETGRLAELAAAALDERDAAWSFLALALHASGGGGVE